MARPQRDTLKASDQKNSITVGLATKIHFQLPIIMGATQV
jgi:hypothetical protein